MVQTNLRLGDANFPQDDLARQVRAFGANVLLYNVGGIFAFYPTDLPLQARNPLMEGDALARAIAAARNEGLALVGRFDMSKATRLAYDAHPSWFVMNGAGEPLEYNGTYQACVNGDWYQDYAFRIIDEALGRYDVDGVFFNMFGYRNRTYSNEYFGPCRCENCSRAFRDFSGKEIPEKEDFSDPNYPDYLQFKEKTTRSLWRLMTDHIHATAPGVAICGPDSYSDVIRMESQRAVARPAPAWPYQSGQQARWGRSAGGGRPASSTSTNFIDFAWRFHAETGALHLLRFAQQLGSGAALDYYLLGVLDQDDGGPLAEVSELFKWHARHEAIYDGVKPAARVALYASRPTSRFSGRTDSAPYATGAARGAYRMLVEARIAFDTFTDEELEADPDALGRYDAIFLPNVTCMSDTEAAALDAWVQGGGLLIATGETGHYDALGQRRDRVALTSLSASELHRSDMRQEGAYFRIEAPEFDDLRTRLLMLDGPYYRPMQVREASESRLRLLPPQRFGPPELCFPKDDDGAPGMLIGKAGKGVAISVPWHPDWMYWRDSLPNHRKLVSSLIRTHAPHQPVVLEGDGPVEVTLQKTRDSAWLVHVINYAGQRNNLYETPPQLHGLRLGIANAEPFARCLRAGLTVEATQPDEVSDQRYRWFSLPPVGAFEVVAIDIAADRKAAIMRDSTAPAPRTPTGIRS